MTITNTQSALVSPDHDTSPRTLVSTKMLVRAQAYSGLLFAVFLGLHLLTLLSALLGQASYDRVMSALRYYYQNPVVELVAVLGAALVHVTASIWRISRRRQQARAGVSRKPSWRVRLHRYSAYYLLVFFAGHAAATRLPSLLGESVTFSFLTFSLRAYPAYFYPYYTLLAAAGLYHLSHGLLVALRVVGVGLPRAATAPRNRIFWLWTATGAVVSLLCVLALGGVLYEVDTQAFANWHAFYLRWFGAAAPAMP